jgi:O-methyltransferase involved in polyketide biosynthesis
MSLDPLSRTALIPFWSRVYDARSASPVLGDAAAVGLAALAKERFGRMEVSESTRLGCCLRNRTVDDWITELIAAHGGTPAAIVDIGVGLDTRVQRLPGVARTYIEIDSEPVLALRDEWLPGTDVRRIVGDGMRVDGWAEHLNGEPLVIVALEGVLTYHPPAAVSAFFANVAQRLPGAYLLFDSLSPLQIRMANSPAALASGRPPYQWGVWSTRRISAGRSRLQVLRERGFMDFPRDMTRSFSQTERFLHAVPPFRRSYRLTLAQLPSWQG